MTHLAIFQYCRYSYMCVQQSRTECNVYKHVTFCFVLSQWRQVWFKNRRAKYRKTKDTETSSPTSDESTTEETTDQLTPLPDSTESTITDQQYIVLDKTKADLVRSAHGSPLRPTPIHSSGPLFGLPVSPYMDPWVLSSGCTIDWPLLHSRPLLPYHH